MRPSPPPTRPCWTAANQCLFLHWLERTRSATRAADKVGLSRESAYRLRARDPDGLFALLWNDIMARPLRRAAGHRVTTSP
ncbi:hypothetical protein [Sphingomonas humi]|uniref:LysR family transcriptional regulator n=1 Tax=Sphingomonas humi TaxID=335630 RepID=A0ABP7RJ52_9SPHN